MTEKDEQIALFDWASYRPDLKLMFHVTNEGRRTVQHTQSLLRQGMKPGVPDIFLPIAKGPYHGLFIEMKRRIGGRQTPEQKEWQRALLEEGYCAVVCKGFEEAKDVIDWYMKGAKR
jgi:hypothetical protein